MTKRKRRTHNPAFKAKAALAAVTVLSDECGTACSAMVADAVRPLIQNCATGSVPLFQLVARGDPLRGDDVCQIPAVAAERRRPAGRARDRYLPRDGAVLLKPVRPDVRR